MIAWLGLVLATGAWLFASTIVVPARPVVALTLGAAGAALMLGGLAGRQRESGEGRWRIAGIGLPGLLAVAAVQWLVHAAYWRVSPYYHPSVGGSVLAALLRAVGADAAADGDNVSIQLLSSCIHVRPSIERLGLYPLALLWSAGLTLRVMTGGRLRWPVLLGSAAVFTLYALGRFVVLSLLSADLESPPLFWNPWLTLASLVPLTILAGAAMPIPPAAGASAPPVRAVGGRRVAGAGGLALIGAAALVLGLHVERVGERKAGRVVIDDLHSGHWEVSTGEFNEQSYGEKAIYTYVCLRDWLSQFYQVRVNTDQRISDDLLRDVDVLLLKTPTQPFLDSERDAVERFVRRGGGLWLVGDHTNLFGMSTYLNPIAGLFGFRFHFDDTFDNNTGRPSRYHPPRLVRHPAVAPLEHMEFETSATVGAPLAARPVMIGWQLGSELVDYGHVNFFGNITVDPEDEYGLFLQAVAASHGAGRVLAFADSTVFSSFSMFLPGVPELAEGSVAFLNHREPGRTWLWALAVMGGLACAAAGWLAGPWRSAAGMTALTLGLAVGVVAGGLVTTARSERLYPPGELKDLGRRAVVDRSISSFRLPSSLEYEVVDPERCFDSFYLNLARLGLHPLMAPGLGATAPEAPLRIFIQPTLPPSREGLAELRQYVERGGRVVILESSVYVTPATRRLLEALGMRIAAHEPGRGVTVGGAEPIATPAGLKPRTPNAVSAHRGKLGAGSVLYVSGAEWFSRKYMGQVYGQPDPLEREFHNLQYHVFHQLEGRAEHVATR